MIVETSVPAKINLWLEVVRKREDGYHDLSTLMLPISVFDRIRIKVGPDRGPVALECNAPEIPHDQRNLAWRAADIFRKSSGSGRAMRIVLEKGIPSGAGLGGGSADAAGVLLTLNDAFDNFLTSSDLDALALRLGADVPFFLYQRAALATGIGEKLEFVSAAPEYPLLLIKPPVDVATAWVYQNLKLTRGWAHIRLQCFNSDPWQLGELVANDLESVTIPKYPVLSEIKEWLLGHGALAASMSGSGPTVFGIFSSKEAVLAAQADAKIAWGHCWIRAAGVIGATNINIRRVSDS